MIFELIVVPSSGRITRPSSNRKLQQSEVLVSTQIMLTNKRISAQVRGVMEAKCAFLLADFQEGCKVKFRLPLEGRDRRAIAEFRHTILGWRFANWDINRNTGTFDSLLREVLIAAREPLHRRRPLRIDLMLSHKGASTWREANPSLEFNGMGESDFMWLECNARTIATWLHDQLAPHREAVQIMSNYSAIPDRLQWRTILDSTTANRFRVAYRNTLTKEQFFISLKHGHSGVERFSVAFSLDEPPIYRAYQLTSDLL